MQILDRGMDDIFPFLALKCFAGKPLTVERNIVNNAVMHIAVSGIATWRQSGSPTTHLIGWLA